jgi:hypothetical protein
MDTEVGVQCFAYKTTTFDGSPVIRVRTADSIVHHAHGAVRLEQCTVRRNLLPGDPSLPFDTLSSGRVII